MSVNPGPHCITGVQNEAKINTLTAQIESLAKTVESLRQAVEDMRLREARRAGAFAAAGALLGASLGNIIKLLAEGGIG